MSYFNTRGGSRDMAAFRKTPPTLAADLVDDGLCMANYRSLTSGQVIPGSSQHKQPELHFPSDCVGPGFALPKLQVPEYVAPDQHVPVLIGSVISPGNFYSMLYGRGFSMALESLMAKMNAFYRIEHQSQKMHCKSVRLGIYCICKYEEEYTRCTIDAAPQEGKVRVSLLDYGGGATVKTEDMFYLRKEFAELPAQAIASQCANLVPLEGSELFKRAAALRLLDLVQDRAIMARVAQFDRKRLKLSISLVDTNGKDDVHVNDLLVEEGLARFRLELPFKAEPGNGEFLGFEPIVEIPQSVDNGPEEQKKDHQLCKGLTGLQEMLPAGEENVGAETLAGDLKELTMDQKDCGNDQKELALPKQVEDMQNYQAMLHRKYLMLRFKGVLKRQEELVQRQRLLFTQQEQLFQQQKELADEQQMIMDDPSLWGTSIVR